MIPARAIYPLKVLWETIGEILSEAQYVVIPDISYNTVVEDIHKFQNTWNRPTYPNGVHTEEEMIMYFLIRDSVNFCYWYGKPSIRPNGSSSGKLAEVLSKQFEITRRGPLFYESVIYQFDQKLKKGRFPLVAERVDCLSELTDANHRARVVNAVQHSPELALAAMIELYPRYTSDVFLKRPSLFIGEIYKNAQFADYESNWPCEIWNFPVPVDYHLPNILRNMGLIVYKPELATKVDHNVQLLKGSEEEVEIRAATVAVCQTLSHLSCCPVCILDEYLFAKRHQARKQYPFHLTITTDY